MLRKVLQLYCIAVNTINCTNQEDGASVREKRPQFKEFLSPFD